jgi:hypothetical protein
MKTHWVEHKGKRVMIADYSHFGADTGALEKEAEYIVELLHKEPLNSALAISNVEGTTASLANVQVLMNVLPRTNQFIHRRCVIGVTGISMGFIETFNRLADKAQIKAFHTLEEALDWIVQE